MCSVTFQAQHPKVSPRVDWAHGVPLVGKHRLSPRVSSGDAASSEPDRCGVSGHFPAKSASGVDADIATVSSVMSEGQGGNPGNPRN
ncbi:unnamed protein product, partial [Amoebophrya sp. A25]|eukprot:GSA25T00023621001.1